MSICQSQSSEHFECKLSAEAPVTPEGALTVGPREGPQPLDVACRAPPDVTHPRKEDALGSWTDRTVWNGLPPGSASETKTSLRWIIQTGQGVLGGQVPGWEATLGPQGAVLPAWCMSCSGQPSSREPFVSRDTCMPRNYPPCVWALNIPTRPQPGRVVTRVCCAWIGASGASATKGSYRKLSRKVPGFLS